MKYSKIYFAYFNAHNLYTCHATNNISWIGSILFPFVFFHPGFLLWNRPWIYDVGGVQRKHTNSVLLPEWAYRVSWYIGGSLQYPLILMYLDWRRSNFSVLKLKPLLLHTTSRCLLNFRVTTYEAPSFVSFSSGPVWDERKWWKIPELWFSLCWRWGGW